MAAMEVVKSMRESLRRRQATSTGHEVEFTCAASKAKKVCIAGNFNGWSMTSMPMKKSADGTWKIKLKISPGRYEYKFVVDGIWAQDMLSSETAPNCFGTYNNVIGVE
jgi:1,4-alpha-glucan branching enzyme